MTPGQRQDSIISALSISKPYSELVSERIDEIQSLISDIQSQENNPATRARLWSELAAQFAGLAARELGAK